MVQRRRTDQGGRIAVGQLADFAILSDDYFSVSDEQIKRIEAVLTVVGGDIVYAAAPFDRNLAPSLPSVSPQLVARGRLRRLFTKYSLI